MPLDEEDHTQATVEPTTVPNSAPLKPLDHSNSASSKPAQHEDTRGSTTAETSEEDQDSNITLHEVEPVSSVKVEKDLEKGEKGGGEPEKYFTEDGTEIIVVQWKGPDDPANPLNWSNARRMTSTLMLVFVFFPFLSSEVPRS